MRRITINYLRNKKNEECWTVGQKPGIRQKKKMLTLAISVGVETVLSGHTYMIGDDRYLQTEGGPIGLELTGAVSRPFMQKWDQLYAEKAENAGIPMRMYSRYVDDSNQIAVVPPPGSRYDTRENKVINDGQGLGVEVHEDERLAIILRDVANTVMDGIEMEADYPSKSPSGKMAILDMEVWMDNNNVLYQHYEKTVASKAVLNAQSAQSAACKRSVHTMEIVRRMLNTSQKLDWSLYVAPILTEYMQRMKLAGYGERYRKAVLLRALGIYDKMMEENEEGIRPLNRPRVWQQDERRRKKKSKKRNWSARGGYIAPIFVPATPGGELAQMLRDVAETEAQNGLKFKVVESGGRSVVQHVQKSNPTATPGCDNADCVACKGGRGAGGNCLKSNIQYQFRCQLCPDTDSCVYIGESSRNLYTRGREHVQKYNSKKQCHESFMWRHQQEKHAGLEPDFEAKVTGMFKDCLTRQVSEGVSLRRSDSRVLNSKSEWHQPALWRVQNEIVRE